MDLCMEGMAAEGAGDADGARKLFEQAWAARKDDFDACIAAHYLARHQVTIETRLEWNDRSLRHADSVLDDRVTSFYPSLYLNLASCYEEIVQTEDADYADVRQARKYFALASERATTLPPGPYSEMVRRASSAGLRRAEAILGPIAGEEPA